MLAIDRFFRSIFDSFECYCCFFFWRSVWHCFIAWLLFECRAHSFWPGIQVQRAWKWIVKQRISFVAMSKRSNNKKMCIFAFKWISHALPLSWSPIRLDGLHGKSLWFIGSHLPKMGILVCNFHVTAQRFNEWIQLTWLVIPQSPEVKP